MVRRSPAMRTGSRCSNDYGSSQRASMSSSTPSTSSNWMAKTCGGSRYETRKVTLASLLRGSLPGLRLNEHLAHDGESVFQHACKMGLEGIGGAPRGGGGLGEGKRVKNPKRLQRLPTGITVRQDFRDCARMVFYDTGNSHWRYATHGGTAFVVVFRGRPYAFTCNHVLKNFEWRQLVITNTKVGRKIAGLQSVAYPTQPHHAAEDTDIVDLVVIEFAPDVTATFFKDTAYI